MRMLSKAFSRQEVILTVWTRTEPPPYNKACLLSAHRETNRALSPRHDVARSSVWRLDSFFARLLRVSDPVFFSGLFLFIYLALLEKRRRQPSPAICSTPLTKPRSKDAGLVEPFPQVSSCCWLLHSSRVAILFKPVSSFLFWCHPSVSSRTILWARTESNCLGEVLHTSALPFELLALISPAKGWLLWIAIRTQQS